MNKFKGLIKQYLAIIVGAIIAGFSVAVFLVPFQIAAGGLSGLGTIIYYFTNGYIPIGATIIALNVPLVLWGLKVLGKHFIFKTIIGLVVISTVIDYLEIIVNAKWINLIMIRGSSPDLLLYSIVGGALLGAGLGLCVKGNATSGGTDLLAMILAKKNSKLSLGTMLLIVDLFIILFAMIVFESIMLGLYGIISLVISTKVIDLIVEGPQSGKIFFIVSEHAKEILEEIINDIGRGATYLNANGAYNNAHKNVIMCTVYRGQVQQMKILIKKIDKDAFIIVSDAREVVGKGFRKS